MNEDGKAMEKEVDGIMDDCNVFLGRNANINFPVISK
jgi:hypothetical protein